MKRTKLPSMGASVLRELCRHDELTRQGIQSLLGVSGSTATRVVSYLLEAGLVESTVVSAGALGRPAEAISLSPTGMGAISISLSARETSMCLVSFTGEISDAITLPVTGETPYSEAVSSIADSVLLLLSRAKVRFSAIAGVGVSFGGSVSFTEGRIADATGFPSWRGKSIVQDLRVATGLQVAIDNDPVALTRALEWFGPPLDRPRFLCYADNGVAGCASGLSVPPLDAGLTAGRFGHVGGRVSGTSPCWCGLFDCLNTVASIRSLNQWATAKGVVNEGSTTIGLIDALERSAEGRSRLEIAGRALAESTIDACRVLGVSDYVLAGRLFDLSVVVRTASYEIMSSSQGVGFHGDFMPKALSRQGAQLAGAAVIADDVALSELVDMTNMSSSHDSSIAYRKGAKYNA